jgi:hypothetical protein
METQQRLKQAAKNKFALLMIKILIIQNTLEIGNGDEQSDWYRYIFILIKIPTIRSGFES